MLYFSRGSATDCLDANALREGLVDALDKLGPRKRVVIVPPDATRIHSFAGDLTRYAWQYFGETVSDILRPRSYGNDRSL